MISNVSENPLWIKQIEARTILRDINTEHWLQNNLFSIAWWVALILVIFIWYFWWKKVDKTRLLEIVAYGLMFAIVATVADLFGVELVLWGYPNMLIPLMPPLFIADFSVLPVTFMLVYQYFSNWNSFAIATLITSFILSFIEEPIAVWFEFYQLNNWKHLYSLPIYIIIALSLKWVMNKIIAKQNSSRCK